MTVQIPELRYQGWSLKRLEDEFSRLAAEAKPLALKSRTEEGLTDEEGAAFQRLADEMNAVGPEMQVKQRMEQQAKSILEADERFNRSANRGAAGLKPIGPPESAKLDGRTVGRRFVDSDEYRAAIQHPSGRSVPVSVGSFYHRTADAPTPEELRTLIATGAFPADLIQPQQVPGIFRGIEPPLNVRDVLINGQTTSDAIVYFRELLFTNAAVEVAQATTTSNGAKPESAITFEQATAPVVTIAHWVPITRQTLQDAAQMETYVNQRLLAGLARREDAQLLNGDGTGANMTGLLATSGIQAADAAYFTANGVNDPGTDNENINRIRRAKTLVRVVGQAVPTFVVLNPYDIEAFETFTDADRQYLMGGPYGTPLRPMWGLRVVESENIAEGTALVGDGTMAAVWDRMQAALYTTDSHSDFFIRNILVILAEERLALTVFRPAAFVEVALV
jgi:HK97 family phage major capsid protein